MLNKDSPYFLSEQNRILVAIFQNMFQIEIEYYNPVTFKQSSYIIYQKASVLVARPQTVEW